MFKSFVEGSFSFLKIHSNKWAVSMASLWYNFASKKVVFSAFSACLVKWRLFFLFPSSILEAAGFNISSFFLIKFKSISSVSNISIAFPSPFLINPSSKCSVPMKSWPNLNASSLLKVITSLTFGEKLSSIYRLFFIVNLTFFTL